MRRLSGFLHSVPFLIILSHSLLLAFKLINCGARLWLFLPMCLATKMKASKLMPSLRKVGKTLFKAEFLHLKRWKMITEPPDHNGNEPTPDRPIGATGQVIKKNKMANTFHL